MSSSIEVPQSAIDIVLGLPPGGRVLLIGATDTGKTTLTASLARALARSGKPPVAIVDGDTGQSEIGSPGVVSLGIFGDQEQGGGERETRGFSRLPMLAGVFVGSVTPRGRALETASAIIQITQSALLLNPKPYCTLIDTPGYVTGSGATLLRTLIEVIRPHLIIALAQGAELEPILRPFAANGAKGQGGVRIHREPIAAETGKKTPAVRATRRAARFGQSLSGARALTLEWEQGASSDNASLVVLEKTWLSYGQPLPPHELQFIGRTLGAPCLHAERHSGGRLTIIVSGQLPLFRQPPRSAGPLLILEQSLRAKQIAIESSERYNGLLCGLISARGELLGIGIVTGIDFLRRSVSVLTQVRAVGAIARVALGDVRLKPDGRELPQLPEETRR